MAALHEDLKNRVATGLSNFNYLINTTGDGTLWASATTVATWQAVTDGEAAKAKYHETDKAIFQINDRAIASLNAMAIFTDADIVAGNTTALIEAGFTADDPTLSATYVGCRNF